MSLFVLLCLAATPSLILAQSEGDVRLVGGSKKNIGRLEIFWQSRWSTFCGLSLGGADAACRQLGFYGFIAYKPLNKVNPNANISKASAETPIAIDRTYCSGGENLHVLRCGYSTDVASDCDHANDIVLQCQTISLWQRPYQTQVRLNYTLYPSSGVLEIYISNSWGNVCGNKFNQVAANSACRQMGYTSASSFSSSSARSTATTWLDGVSCGTTKQSCDCLSGCFGDVPSRPISCSNNHFVHVTCTYDVKIAPNTPPGSQDICLNKASCDGHGSGTHQSKTYIVIVVGVVLLLVVFSAVVVLLLCLVVRRYNRRGHYDVLGSTNY